MPATEGGPGFRPRSTQRSAKAAYIIADNQLAMSAGWDDEILRAELAALQEEDFDLNLIGFDPHELDELLLGDTAEDSEDIVPDPPANPVTIDGDIWICGPHRVLCGDCTQPDVVARLLGSKKPRLMVTDPPYGIELDSEWRDHAGLNGCVPAEASYVI